MSNRKPTVGGNWKMNTNLASARELASAVVSEIGAQDDTDVAVFPPFPYLLAVGEVVRSAGTSVRLGAQNLYHQPDGAFTGEVSCAMLKDCGVSIVLAGHSERRHSIGEPDVTVNAKVKAALAAGLDVILCVGETLEQREAGLTDEINLGQTAAGFADVSGDDLERVTIAYEPVWAIGTGKTASAADAQDAHAKIRAKVAELYSQAHADAIRIQYGGSVKPGNAAELFAQPDIDGGLIGGASLKSTDFAAIVEAARGVAAG